MSQFLDEAGTRRVLLLVSDVIDGAIGLVVASHPSSIHSLAYRNAAFSVSVDLADLRMGAITRKTLVPMTDISPCTKCERVRGGP
jgi:hypothetical protein